MLGHRKYLGKQGPHTSWRVQTKGQVRRWKEFKQARGAHRLESTISGTVRMWKEYKQARGTYFLESADGGTNQDMKRIRASKGHSQTGEYRWRDKSGLGRNLSK